MRLTLASLASFASFASVAFLALSGAGCSSSSSGTTTDTDAGSDAPADTATNDAADSATTDSAADSMTMDTLPDAAAATCADFCTGIQAACTGARAQFTTMASCLSTCASWPAGTAGAMSGGSLACRAYHLSVAVSDPATHCKHAGPSGGDNDPTDVAPGVCGEGCESFCDLAMTACSTTDGGYADRAACLAECKSFKADPIDYSTADTTNNDFGCRLYHLTMASTDAMAAMHHCPHIRANSPVCTL